MKMYNDTWKIETVKVTTPTTKFSLVKFVSGNLYIIVR